MKISDPDEDFVHEGGVAVSAVPTPQSMRVLGSELVAPEANRLVGDDDSSPGQPVLDIPVAEIETIVELDGVLNDLSRKSVALVLSSRAFHPRDGRATTLNLVGSQNDATNQEVVRVT